MTEDELIRLAFNRIGVGVSGQPITAGQHAEGRTLLQAAIGEVNAEALIDFNLNDIPDRAQLALADMVAADLGPSYSTRGPRSRSSAKLALLSMVRPDDHTEITQPEYY